MLSVLVKFQLWLRFVSDDSFANLKFPLFKSNVIQLLIATVELVQNTADMFNIHYKVYYDKVYVAFITLSKL